MVPLGSEGSESGAVKCSTLTASLAAPHTASDPLPPPLQTPLPLTNWCFLVEGVGFLVEGKETFFPPLAGWFACVVRRSS